MFRREVLQARQERLSGDVYVITPITWQIIGIVIFCSVLSLMAFLSFATYSRIVTASGSIEPTAGVAAILPTRSGVVTALSVHDGQSVRPGAALAAVRVEEEGTSAVSWAQQLQNAIASQDANLTAQSVAAEAAYTAQKGQLAAQRTGLQEEAQKLVEQIDFQKGLVESARRDYERGKAIADRGFLSLRDLQAREEAFLSRQQGLSQLTQSLANKRAAILEAERNTKQVDAQARAQSASIAAARAEVAQQAASASGNRSYALRAPIAGHVTAITARVGQSTSGQTPLMAIIPAGSRLRAELAVPTSAIAFLKKGQTVRLAIDAFPYERFGTVTGKIRTISASPINAQTSNGTTVSVYPVFVDLQQTNVFAYGRQEPLLAGMTLTARIVTEEQSLIQWLFEPVFAVRRR